MTGSHTDSIVPLGAFERMIGEGILRREPLPLDFTAEDLSIAQARAVSGIQREADRYGVVAHSRDVRFDQDVDEVGIFGFADPLRRTTLVGTWTLDLGPAPKYLLRYGPAHGLEGHLEEYRDSGALAPSITVVGQRVGFATFGSGDRQTLAVSEGVYVLAGYDPGIAAVVYDHEGRRS